MTADQARAVLFEALRGVAPEIDPAGLDPRARLRDQVDLDSMDLLEIFIQIARISGVDVPESDYRRLETIEAGVEYLVERGAVNRDAGA